MEHHRFSKSSEQKLINLHPDLVSVAYLALSYSKYDFGITETLRTIEQQEIYVKEGKSETMNSRHLENEGGYSEALDIKIWVNGSISWKKEHFSKVAAAFFEAAIELGVKIEWGGHWESFFDGPHFQLKKLES